MLKILEKRFKDNMHRHPDVSWSEVNEFLDKDVLEVLKKMEETGGEPDVFILNARLVFVDFSKESPKGRRGLTYDRDAELLRIKKDVHPKGNVLDMAENIGIKVLSESEYFTLQSVEDLDLKTSSWLLTDDGFREKGGALFGEKRYGRTFVYTNGAQSFYSARGFRGYLIIS